MNNKLSKSFFTYMALGVLGLYSKNTDAQVSLAATGGTLAGSYTTMEAAFTAINAGTHTGAITISITGNTTETISAVLNASGSGAASYTSIGISPSGGVARTISGSIAGPLIDFNGADNVTINGINAGGDALVIENQDISTTSSTIRFINDASTNTIQNCTVLGASSAINTGTIVFSTADATLLAGNDGNTISNCTIDASGANFPSTAILCNGNAVAGQENSGIVINNNNIANFFSASIISSGISVSAGGTNWTITNNKFYQTATRTYTTANTHKAVRVASGDAHTVSNNTIGFANAAGTGTYAMTATNATRFIAIDLALAAGGTATSVQGNTVTAISLATSSGAATTNGVLCGINVTSGSVNIGNILGNTIGGSSGTNLLTVTSTTTQAAIVGIHCASTGALLISGNTMGGFSSQSATASVAGTITGINISNTPSALSITNNTIGNTTANNMIAGILGTTTGSSLASGINLSGAMIISTTITGNTIQNLSSYGTGTAGYVRGIWTGTSGASTHNITNNTISNLLTNNANASFTNGQLGAMGIYIGTGTAPIINNNIITNVSNLNAGAVSTNVAGISHAVSSNAVISNNQIYSINNASTVASPTLPALACGIFVRGGTNNLSIFNNMISLGVGQTSNTSFVGVSIYSGGGAPTIIQVFHNTIYIGGTAASGAQPTMCVYRGNYSTTAVTFPVDIRNNILENARTGGTGLHMAIANNYGATASATGWGANASNNNILNAASTSVGYWTTAQTFAGWKTASASDAASYTAATVTYVNNANNLHLNMGVTANLIESQGQNIASVTTDIDGQSRPGPAGSVNGGGISPDLGADEFDGVILDIAAPMIVYTPLNFTCQTTDRTFTATITDITGIPTSGALQPRVYYRKNAGAWFSSQGVLTSGTGTNGTWTFTIVAADMGGLAITDNITYFVIAQDVVASPNIASSPSAGLVATDVNTVTTAPTTPNNYNISPTISGTYTVGATGTFPTLTAAVFAYNNSCLGGPVVFSLIDATYPSETYPITIISNAYSSATNTLTITPATGVSPTFSGSTTTAVFLLNGADYVTIDGGDGTGSNSICPRSNAGRALTIAQTNVSTTAAIISLQTTAGGDAATNNKLMNCNIIGNANTTTLVGINIGGTTIGSGAGANGNSNNQIINNSIRQAVVGIFSSGSTISTKNANNVFDLNDMTATGTAALGRVGIALVFEDNVSVQGNKIANISFAGSNDVLGITLGAVSASNTLAAGSEVTNATVAYNMIDNLVQSNTFSSVGINMAAASTGINTVANNTVTNIFANGTSPDFAGGIYYGGGAGALRVYYNTVHVTGATLTGGTQPNIALAINGTTPSVDIQNNILMCTGENGANGNTGIGLAYTSTIGNYANLISNNNNIFVSGTTGAVIGRVGGLAAGTTKLTLADWQTETGRDLNSQNINPVFVSASDWHLNAGNSVNAPLLCGGTPVSVTSDYACQTRSSTPTIGAYENPLAPANITLAEVSGNTNNDGTLCVGAMLTLTAPSGTNYAWSGPNSFTSTNGAPSINNITLADAGTYMVTVTNGGCITTGTTTIVVNDAPTATSAPTNINCFGANDGMVTSNIAGGSAPYTLLWSNGATTNDITGLSTGTYNLTVTDANNCASSTSMVTITEPSALSVTATANSVSCNGGSNGSVDLATSGGTPTYDFIWSNGVSAEDLTNLSVGTYDVTITDNLGCVAMTSVTISEPAASSVTATGNNVLCFGDANGDATAVGISGTGAFTYMWSNSATGATVTGLAAGAYTVTATDANGCEATTTITISEPSALDATATTDNDASCIGCPDGAASVNTTGGTGGYTFMWSNSETTATVSGLVAGMYYVTVTDANGCMDMDSTEVSQPTNLITTNNTLDQVSVYPNPTSDVVYVDNIPVDARLRLMNTLGQVIFERTNINQNNIMVDMKELPAAGYWIEIQSNNARVTKLVVKRE